MVPPNGINRIDKVGESDLLFVFDGVLMMYKSITSGIVEYFNICYKAQENVFI